MRGILQYWDYALDPSLYVDDVSSEDRGLATQFLFSYKLNPQTVFFLGYADGHYASDEYDLTQGDRTFFVKLGYAWVL